MQTRSWRLAGLAAVGATALAGLAVVIQAPALAEFALARALASRGLTPSRVSVDRVGLSGAHLAALHVGDGLGVRVEDVTLEYSLAGLVRGSIARVEIGVLAVDAALIDGRVSLGAVDALFAAAPAGVRDARAMPPPRDRPPIPSETRGPANFPSQLGIARLALTLKRGDEIWRADGPLGLVLDARGVRSLAAALRARGPRGIAARLEAHTAPGDRVAFTLDADSAAALAPGAARLQLASRGTFAAPWLHIWDPRAREPHVAEIEGDASFALHTTGLAWRERAVALQTAGALKLAGGRFALELDAVQVDGLAARVTGSAHLDGALAPARIEHARVEIAPYAEPGLSLPALTADFRGAANADAASGSFDLVAGPGDASFGATTLRGARLSAVLLIDATREALALRLPACGELKLARAEAPGVRLGRSALCLRDLGEPLLQLAFGDAGGGGYALRVESRSAFVARIGDSQRVHGELPAVELRGDFARPGISLALRGGDLTLDAQPVSLQDARAQLALGDAGWSLELESARLAPREGAPLAAPLLVSGRAAGGADFVRFALTATDARQQARLEAHGVHHLTSSYGVARIELPPVLIGASGLQLEELLADGAALPPSSGELGARGAIAWNPRRILPDLDVSIARLEFAAEGVTARGAHGVIRLRGFDPLSTAPAQRVTAAELDVGVPLADPELIFELADGERLTISRLAAGFAGGRTALSGVIDARASDQVLALTFDTVDMAEILRLAEVDDVIARGRVSGRVPLELRDGQIRVLAGALRSTEQGVIQMPPDGGLGAIGSGGASGEFVRDVLADFHFSELKLAIDGTLGGVLQLRFTIRGSNPSIQGGREILLNLTVNESIVGGVETQALWRSLIERMRSRGRPSTVDSRAPQQENGSTRVARKGEPS